jgi:hypothetical protein
VGLQGGTEQGGGQRCSPERLRGGEEGGGSVVAEVPVGGGAPVIFGILRQVLQQGAEEGDVRRVGLEDVVAGGRSSPRGGKVAVAARYPT